MILETPDPSEFQSRQDYIELINNKYDSLRMLSSLVRHDVKNLCEEFNYYHEQFKDQLPKEYQAQYKDIATKMQESIALLSSSEQTEFNFIKVLVPIIQNTNLILNMDLQCDALRIRTDVRFFVSVITNVLNNAKEAYIRKYNTVDELMILIRNDKDTIIIEDNAGGFDISAIDYGNTHKANSENNSEHYHGFFLKTMIEKCHLFNMKFGIEPIKGGTRISIRINSNKESPDDKPNNKLISPD